MKLQHRTDNKHSELRASLPVVALLAAAIFAKLGAAAQIVHLAH